MPNKFRICDIIVDYVNDLVSKKVFLSSFYYSQQSESSWDWFFFKFDIFYDFQFQDFLPSRGLQLDEMFGSCDLNTVFLGKEKNSYVNITKELNEYLPKNSLEILSTHKFFNKKNCFFLRIEKEDIPPTSDDILNSISKDTWYSNNFHLPEFIGKEIKITVGAHHKTIITKKGSELVQVNYNDVFLAIFSEEKPKNKKIECSLFIPYSSHFSKTIIDSVDLLVGIKFPLIKYYGITPDLGVKIEIVVVGHFNNRSYEYYFNMIGSNCANLTKFIEKKIENSKKKIGDEMQIRKNLINTKREVFYEGKKIGIEPSNENEVLIMVGRLEEKLRKKFSEFMILEHTSQTGIDGFLSIKRGPNLLEDKAAVEFEFDFDNFFQHQHPFHVVNYVICWRWEKAKTGDFYLNQNSWPALDGIKVQIIQHDWYYIAFIDDSQIRIFVLNKMPELMVK